MVELLADQMAPDARLLQPLRHPERVAAKWRDGLVLRNEERLPFPGALPVRDEQV